jgi:hypothetical protein
MLKTYSASHGYESQGQNIGPSSVVASNGMVSLGSVGPNIDISKDQKTTSITPLQNHLLRISTHYAQNSCPITGPATAFRTPQFMRLAMYMASVIE